MIDFIQMPWSRSASTWGYYDNDILAVLQKAISSGKRPVRIQGEASGNDSLRGRLQASSEGFTAQMFLDGHSTFSADHIEQVSQSAKRFFVNLEAKVYMEGESIVTSIVARFSKEEKGRLDFLLKSLWDLQVFSQRIPVLGLQHGATV